MCCIAYQGGSASAVQAAWLIFNTTSLAVALIAQDTAARNSVAVEVEIRGTLLRSRAEITRAAATDRYSVVADILVNPVHSINHCIGISNKCCPGTQRAILGAF
jgi:hypothetical protein